MSRISGAARPAARPLVLGAALTLAAALGGCGRHAQQPQPGPPQVGVMTVVAQPVSLTTELPGRTDSYLSSDVRPQVNGIIKARLFEEGSQVRAGQPLYQIDPAPYQAAYDQAAAQLANAQAAVGTDRLKAERYADLLKIKGVARQDYDDAEAAYKQALASVQQAKAALESARINLGYTKVTAPISGWIGRSAVTPGALVTADQTTALATIQALDPIYVDVTQSTDELLRLKQALAGGRLDRIVPSEAPVSLILSDGSSYPQRGRLKFSEVTVDQTTDSVTLRAVFPNPNRVLLPGMYVRAEIAQATDPNGVVVPQQAVSHDPQGQATAFVVGPGNKAEQRVLTLGPARGNQWVVTKGLQAGDRLIIDGLMKVRPGAPVRPVAAAPPPPMQAAQPPAPPGAPAR